MPNEFSNHLKHIIDKCDFVISVIKPHTINSDFLNDETLKRAVIRSLEIIGEASKKIPVDIKLNWNTVQWKNVAGMRDRLIHDYMGVNYNIVWDVALNKIPPLRGQMAEILNSETKS